MSGCQRTRDKVLEAITAPLGFYVLALLIVETFLGAAFFGGNFDAQTQFDVIYVGVGMFGSVVVIVTLLVCFKPENLTFDKDAHLELSKAAYGTDSKTVDRGATRPSETGETNGS